MCVGQANTMADRLFCCKCLGAKFQSPLNGSMCGLPCSLSLALEPKTSPLSGVGGGKKKKKRTNRNFIKNPAPQTCSQVPDSNSWRWTGLLLVRGHIHHIILASCAQVPAHTWATCSYCQYKQIMDVPEFSCRQPLMCFKLRQWIPVCAGGTTIEWFRLKSEPKA